MKMTIDSKSLVDAIQWVTKSFNNRDEKAFITLTVDNDGYAYVSHSNLTSFLKSDLSISDVDLGDKDSVSYLLQGVFVQRLGGSLDATGTSELKATDSGLVLKNNLGKFTIPTFKKSPPSLPEFSTIGSVDGTEFFDGINRLAKICDLESAGAVPVLGAVNVSLGFEDKNVKIMATDRYALGEIVVEFEPSSEGTEIVGDKTTFLVPHDAATMVSARQATASVDIILEEGGGKFGYSFPDGKVALFSLQDTNPIDYKKLKDNASKNVTNSMKLSTKELQKAISVISNLEWNENEIYFKLSEDGLTISDSHGTNKLVVEVEQLIVDEERSVKFVRSVINKAFAPVGTTSMYMKWADETSPFVFNSILDSGEVSDNVFVLTMTSQ